MPGDIHLRMRLLEEKAAQTEKMMERLEALLTAAEEYRADRVAITEALGLTPGAPLDQIVAAATAGKEAVTMFALLHLFRLDLIAHTDEDCPENNCHTCEGEAINGSTGAEDDPLAAVQAALKIIQQRGADSAKKRSGINELLEYDVGNEDPCPLPDPDLTPWDDPFEDPPF